MWDPPQKMPRGSLSLAHADDPPCDARHNSFHPRKNFVQPTSNLLQISHTRNSVRPTFNLLRISHIRRLTPNGRGGRFNFPGQTCLDPLDSALWITAQVRIHIRSGHFLYAYLDSHMCMITLSIHWFPYQFPWLLYFISRDPTLGT